MPGGIETVLVVEDDPLVRGYVVIECADGKTDLMALRRGEEVDLLFSDIFLSDNMYGITLSQEARRLRPHLKVLVTSGNASGSAGAASRLAGHHVLAKPYGRGSWRRLYVPCSNVRFEHQSVPTRPHSGLARPMLYRLTTSI